MPRVVLVCLHVNDDITKIYQGDNNILINYIHETVAAMLMMTSLIFYSYNNNISVLLCSVPMLLMTSLEYISEGFNNIPTLHEIVPLLMTTTPIS